MPLAGDITHTDTVYPPPAGHDAKPQITATGKAAGLFNWASVLNSGSWRRTRESVNLYQDDTVEARLIRRMSPITAHSLASDRGKRTRNEEVCDCSLSVARSSP